MYARRVGKLVIFEAVARHASFSEAATELGLSKSTVSQHLAGLEDEMGVQLLNRTSRSVSLTQDGELLLPHAVQIVEAAAATNDAVQLETQTASGVVSITASHNMAINYLGPAIGRFRRRHPAIGIHLLVREGYVDLIAEGVDLAIRAGILSDSELIMRRIGLFRLIACCTPEYLSRFDPVTAPEDLEAMEWVIITAVDPGRAVQLTGPGAVHSKIRVNPTFETNSGLMAMEMIRGGAGVGFLPDFAIHRLLANGTLVDVLPGWAQREGPLSLVWTPMAKRKLRVKLLIDFIIADFRQHNHDLPPEQDTHYQGDDGQR